MQPTLADLETLARRAGEILMEGYQRRPGFGNQIKIEYKGVIDLVSEIDRRSEELLVSEIRRRFPDHHIVTEESGEFDGEGCFSWYIDPLDGTVNYLHGIPMFAVSIGVARDRILELGVVYDPVRDECFSGERGRGAWLNGEPIRASQAEDLNHSLLVTGFPYDIRTSRRNNLNNFTRLSLLSQGVRRLGSAALDLCYTASGRVDGYWEISISSWDITAGVVIAREAGAAVSTLNGDSDFLRTPTSVVAAGTPAVHRQLLKVLNEEE